ncbi:MAG TPA: protein kinase [Steroidobacteraceae bacterium]|jgi:serine/threonine-protein kinase
MNFAPGDLTEVLALLKSALELPVDQRSAWLETLDASRARLKHTVIEFLQQHAEHETGDVLRTLSDYAAEDEDGLSGTQAPVSGHVIGPYRLLRAIGEGGMSSVWLAERDDGVIKRKIALKLPHWWALSKLTDRAVQERDILASLEHPNIARLYDAGITVDGRPYLALEFIEGRPIDDYCRERQLDTRARVELAIQVIRAVAYAHSRLVVHRDLKPSNILVDSNGQVHLLDFGIAKLLEEGTTASKALTRVGARVLTPEYASPEQLTGEPVTTSSDVYSLGVVLYELLCEKLPYEFKSAAATDWEILSSEIAPPSSAVEPKIARSLRGDLDTIVLKALKKERGDRYDTAAALADDLESYLRGDPVLARPDSTWYRLSKFSRKNRLAVGAVTAVVIALAAGLAVASAQLRVARDEKERAEEVKEFVASIFRSADPYFTGNHSMSAAQLLTLAKERIDEEMASQPRNGAELLTIVGEAQSNLEQYDEARATLSAAIKQASRTAADNGLYSAQALVTLASIDLNEGHYDVAKRKLDAAIPALRRHGKPASRSLVNALASRGYLAVEEGDNERSIDDNREAVDIAIAELGRTNSETILATRQLAQAYLVAGKIPQAIDFAKQANDSALASFGSGGRNALLVETEDVYGRALVESGNLEEGIAHLSNAVTSAAAAFGEPSGSVASKLTWLARAQQKLGDLPAAITSLERARKSATSDLDRARASASLGVALIGARQLDRATSVLEQATKDLKRLDTNEASWWPNAIATYAIALALDGRAAEAQRTVSEGLASGKARGPAAADLHNGLGMIAMQQGDPKAAITEYQQALQLSGPEEPPTRQRAAALSGLGLSQLAMHDLDRADATLQQAEAVNRKLYRRMTPAIADGLLARGRVAAEQKRIGDALALFDTADAYWRDFAPTSRWAGEAAYWHGRALLAANRHAEALGRLQVAVSVLGKQGDSRNASLLADANTQLTSARRK